MLGFHQKPCYEDRFLGYVLGEQTVDRSRQCTSMRQETQNWCSLTAHLVVHKDLGSQFYDEYESAQPTTECSSRLRQLFKVDLPSDRSTPQKFWLLDWKVSGIRQQIDQYAFILDDDEAQN